VLCCAVDGGGCVAVHALRGARHCWCSSRSLLCSHCCAGCDGCDMLRVVHSDACMHAVVAAVHGLSCDVYTRFLSELHRGVTAAQQRTKTTNPEDSTTHACCSRGVVWCGVVWSPLPLVCSLPLIKHCGCRSTQVNLLRGMVCFAVAVTVLTACLLCGIGHTCRMHTVNRYQPCLM
jgi:hypothetical protein